MPANDAAHLHELRFHFFCVRGLVSILVSEIASPILKAPAIAFLLPESKSVESFFDPETSARLSFWTNQRVVSSLPQHILNAAVFPYSITADVPVRFAVVNFVRLGIDHSARHRFAIVDDRFDHRSGEKDGLFRRLAHTAALLRFSKRSCMIIDPATATFRQN